MSVNDAATTPRSPSRYTFSDIALDGLVAGVIGAAVVALFYFIVDMIHHQPLHTPSLLGSVLLHGADVAREAPIEPLPIAAYTAFHAISFMLLGLGLSWMVALIERVPMMAFVMLLLSMFLQVGFFGLDAALNFRLTGQLGAGTIVAANSLSAIAMVFYLWKRHPRIKDSLSHMWDQDRS